MKISLPNFFYELQAPQIFIYSKSDIGRTIPLRTLQKLLPCVFRECLIDVQLQIVRLVMQVMKRNKLQIFIFRKKRRS